MNKALEHYADELEEYEELKEELNRERTMKYKTETTILLIFFLVIVAFVVILVTTLV